MKKKWLLLGFAFLLQLNGWAVSDGHVVLNAFAYKNQVKLLWQAYGWPKDVVGFNLKRKTSENEDWKVLNQTPICPRIDAHASYSNQGLSKTQEAKVKRFVAKMFAEKHLRTISKNAAIKRFQSKGMQSGDRIMMKRHYSFSLALGFGYIDNDAQKDTTYEYALFGVKESGVELKEPLATCRAVWVGEKKSNISVHLVPSKKGNAVELKWSCLQEVSDLYGVLKWKIYRKKNKKESWKLINEIGILSGTKNEKNISWTFFDEDSNAREKYYYAVAPQNKFQFEFMKNISVYIPPTLHAAEITTLNVEDKIYIHLEWGIDREILDLIDSVKILRLDEGDKEFHLIKKVSKTSRLFLDMFLGSKKHLTYKIVVVGKGGQILFSKPKKIYIEGRPRPESPDEIKLTFFKKDGIGYVRGDWVLPKSSTSLTSYRLFNNKALNRKLYENGSHCLGITNSYTWILKNEHGNRDFTFGIQSVDSSGMRGKKILGTIYVPRLKAPRKIKLNVKFSRKDGNIYLDWTYPMEKDLVGFRLYLGEKMILSEKQLTKNVRRWILTDYPESYVLRFRLEAVFPFCTYMTPCSSLLQLGGDIPDRDLLAPKGFMASLLGVYDGSYWVEFSWDKEWDPKTNSRIVGYRFNVGDINLSAGSVIFRTKVCNKYYFKIPKKLETKKLYFQCRPISKHRYGLYSDVKYSRLLSEMKRVKKITKEKYEKMIKYNKAKKKWN